MTHGDHPRGNHWFASSWQEGDEPHPEGFPWRVYIQLPGMVDHLSAWFPTEEAAEQYIRDDILGAGSDIEKHPVIPGQIVVGAPAIKP